ncbi:MAG: HD domain-containing phosphohydrolase [Candidatus Omnitrophota bacterium]|jgi:diguanylate cyclase (GGDEF)-like protein/PAS domain S-box-containing protein
MAERKKTKKKIKTTASVRALIPSQSHKKFSDLAAYEISGVMLDNVMMGIVIISPDLKIVWCNKTFKKWFPKTDYLKTPACYKTFFTQSKNKPCDNCPVLKALKTGQTHSAETALCNNDRIYKIIATPIKDAKAKTLYVFETVEDITVRKRMEDALKDSESQYHAMIDAIGEAIHVIDKEFRIVLFNTSFKKLNESLGLESDVVGRKLFEVFCFLPDTVRAEYQKVFTSGKILVSEETNRIGERDIVTETRKIPVFEGNSVVRVITIVRDITEYKKKDKKVVQLNEELLVINKRLKQLVLRDPQTGLFNHRYLLEIIDPEFERAKRSGSSLSVMMLDIDYFKSINEVYGHQFGDLVLKQLAQQLRKMLRDYDIVVRFSGEEFVVISPGLDRSAAFNLSQRILDAFNLYNFGNKRTMVKLKLSIAVASYPENRVLVGMELIELTEQILSKVKQSGGNNVFTSLDIQKDKTSAEKQEDSSDVGFLRDKIDKLTKEANQSLIEAVLAFAKTLELKDHYTGEHVERTVYYATELARALSLSKNEIERIKQASILHDLGKIGISDKILLKNSKLSKEEFEEIKRHPRIGVDIIRPIQFLHALIPYILYHHERWDGKGYPNGLKGEDIPIGARIIALADVYQALTSDRPYRKAFSKEEALKIIQEGSGTQFDPTIVAVFLKVLKNEGI